VNREGTLSPLKYITNRLRIQIFAIIENNMERTSTCCGRRA